MTDTITVYRNKIYQFSGSWGSGLGFLSFEDGSGVPCDNGPTVRALEHAFGNVISEGHTASGQGAKGQDVAWSYDELGLTLGGFTPYNEWLDRTGVDIPPGGSVEYRPTRRRK